MTNLNFTPWSPPNPNLCSFFCISCSISTLNKSANTDKMWRVRKGETWKLSLFLCLYFFFCEEMVLCEQMVLRDSRSVCEPFSSFLFFSFIFHVLFFYGAFSTCVSYLCICRLTFQSQSPHPECLDVLLTEILSTEAHVYSCNIHLYIIVHNNLKKSLV